jgi:hypothetical protein
MGNFKKLLKAVVCLMVALFLVAFVNYEIILNYRKPYMNSYLASVIDKEALLANTSSPKIILIGGSNVAFGLDSTALKEETGLPVVNIGIQGGLGLHYILNLAKPYIHEGDILVISPEYHVLLTPLQSGDVLSDLLILYPKGFLNLSTLREMWEVGKDFPAVHTRIIAEDLETQLTNGPTPTPMLQNEKVYYRDAFNPETGDITTNNVTVSHYSKSFELSDDISYLELWGNIQYLNTYQQYAKSKKATVYFLFPATAIVEDNQTKSILVKTADMLKKDLKMPILNTWDDSQFSFEYMFDTDYHLNNMGRTIHTERLISELCQNDPTLTCK